MFVWVNRAHLSFCIAEPRVMTNCQEPTEGNLTLVCTVDSSAPYSVSWLCDGMNVTAQNNTTSKYHTFHNQSGHFLIITAASKQDPRGNYTCVVTTTFSQTTRHLQCCMCPVQCPCASATYWKPTCCLISSCSFFKSVWHWSSWSQQPINFKTILTTWCGNFLPYCPPCCWVYCGFSVPEHEWVALHSMPILDGTCTPSFCKSNSNLGSGSETRTINFSSVQTLCIQFCGFSWKLYSANETRTKCPYCFWTQAYSGMFS